jgi:hypothetical protein
MMSLNLSPPISRPPGYITDVPNNFELLEVENEFAYNNSLKAEAHNLGPAAHCGISHLQKRSLLGRERLSVIPRMRVAFFKMYSYSGASLAKKKMSSSQTLLERYVAIVGCGSTADKRKKVDCSMECTSKLIYMRDMNVHVST